MRSTAAADHGSWTDAPTVPGVEPLTTGLEREWDDLARASEAALGAVGSGTVTEAERSDDADHAFEVEVTREDGTDVDVELDAAFAVLSTQE